MTQLQTSMASWIASLPESERRAELKRLAPTPEAKARLRYSWRFFARPDQLWPVGDWRVWLLMAGRGFGKTRTGAEAVRDAVERGYQRIALVGPTAADVRDVMIEGESGILATSPPWDRPVYEPSKRRLTWPSGAIATAYSADEPNRLRGPQHDFAWADEIAAWKYADAWDQLMFGLRLGADPRCVATTTPRPKTLIRELLAAPTTHVTRGSTYDNAQNLAPAFLDAILSKYEGTTLGQQEIYAQLLEETPGALWQRVVIERNRHLTSVPSFARVGVAVDPAVTSSSESDETGILGGGIDENGIIYITHDRSLRASPDGWAKAALWTYHQLEADRLIGEVNNGGDMVETIVRHQDRTVSYKSVRASRGKYARAEPVAALYEQNRVRHVGVFGELEDQMCTWTPDVGWSPDRMDALVWLVWWLARLGGSGGEPRIRSLA